MNLRLLSTVAVVVFMLSSGSVHGEANSLGWYKFPNNSPFSHVYNSRDAAWCPKDVGGTAVYPWTDATARLTGEILCDQEAIRQWVNKAYINWYASPVFGTWDSPGDNKLCKWVGNNIQIVGGGSAGGKWTNIVICKYEPFECGDRWRFVLQRWGPQNLHWGLNWTKLSAGRDYANVGGVQFKCMPEKCTTGICRGTPAANVDECFKTRDGTYKKLNGAVCPFCPAGEERVNTGSGNFSCVADKCSNIPAIQTTVPAGTTRNAAGACTCNNGGGNPPTCTPPTTPPASTQCSDGVDNDADGKTDFPADPGCTSATDTTEADTALAQCADGIDNDGDGKIDFVAPAAAPTIPATYNFTTSFPGISYTPPGGDPGYDIMNIARGKDPSIPPAPIAPTVANLFSYTQTTADKVCQLMGYQTAVMSRPYAYRHSQHKVTAWENNEWVLKGWSGPGMKWLTCSNPIASGGTILADPDCSSATDDSEWPDTLTCPAGETRKPTPESPVCLLVATPRTTPAGTSFTLTGYEHLTGNCTLAGMTTHDTPPKAISPLVSLGLSVSPTISNISASTESTFTTTTQLAGLLTCPVAGNSACSIGTGGVITCGCYNAGVTPPGTTTTTTTIPATYDFSVAFPGVNYAITERDGERSFSRDIVGVVNAHSPSLGLSHPTDTVSFYNSQPTANQACRVLGYQTAEIFSRNSFDGTGGRKVAVYENSAWVIKSLSGNNDVINGLRCSSPIASGTTTGSAVVPPTYTCVGNRCTEGQYYCAAENICKPASQSCSSITCNKNNICDADESCDCSDCTKGIPDNDKDKCWISGGQQLYCTKDSATNENIRFPFCLPACLDGQACATTCNTQVGACCPAGSTWNSVADACVPATCGKGQFYCAHQQKCLPGGTTCEPGTPVTCVNDGVCSGDESCQCADCVDGNPDDKDKCSIIGGLQAMCSDDNLTDGLPGACCVPPEKWDTATKTCKACSNTQAPAQLKANYDQPYIACTGNGVLTDTHFRYKLTKQGSADAPFVSDIFSNSTQVLHPKLPTGMYTVECFYGTSTTVDTSSTATPHSCVKTMEAKDVNLNLVNGCSRIYGYKWTTLSDEMTSNSPFSATFRCGSRMDTKTSEPNPFSLRIGTNTPITLGYDLITELFAEFWLGISSASTSQNFATGSTPVACAVMVGGGYSTNDYCRLTACVGDNCNVPKAFSVVHSNDKVCTIAETEEYDIGCNPNAPTEVLNACVAMFDEAVRNIVPAPAPGQSFPVKMHINGSIPNNGVGVECVKYGPGQMPHAQNIYGTVSCTALLPNGEYYEVYASDSGGNQISSLQSKGRTVERDTTPPTISEVKYYTDSSLTQDVAMTKWYNKPVYAAVICSDTPLGESLACSCAKKVDPDPTITTNPDAWNDGVQFGWVDVGADILRYTRVIPDSITTPQSVGVIDTAGLKSDKKNFAISIDTKAPKMEVDVPSGTGSVKTISLTATDDVSKIWKNTLAPTSPTGTNSGGIVYRRWAKADIESLTFDEECDLGASDAFFATTTETGLQTTATVSITDVNTTSEVVTYCVRDNAGNTTRGIYPVITDACFSASNMPAPVPNLDTYKGFTSTRLWSTTFTANQKYGYSFSENTTNAACFRGILATNIQTLVTNQLTPRTSTTLTSWTDDRAMTQGNTPVPNTNGYYYYRYTSSSSTLNLTTSPTGTGTKSVIVEGGDIHIKANMTYSGPGQSLILIARKNSSGNGGNITIDPTVTNIDAILIADGGAVRSADSTTPGERLTINGRIYSYNTRGGSLKPSGADVVNADTPKVFNASGALVNATDFLEAQRQDLERLRPIFVDSDTTCSLRLNYYAYTTSTLPILLQRPAGYTGGNCAF